MSDKSVALRRQARHDIEEAIDHYLAESGVAVTMEFIQALENSLEQIRSQPASGSPRYAHELDIPGLRSWIVGKFPHLVFYVEKAEEIDI